MSAIVVIPARYASTRFPGKPLALLKGMPLIQHVYQNSLNARLAGEVIVATDSETIFETVMSFGGKAVITSPDHQSGTDRIAEVAAAMNCDIMVNVQGDEPLIRPEMIDAVISVLDDKRASLGTLAIPIRDSREIFDPNVVKVVFDSEGFAWYFSRAPIPYHRDEWNGPLAQSRELRTKSDLVVHDCYKHIGIYSYRRDVLLKLSSLPPARLENIEKLEQLRAIETGFRIKVRETSFETIGVDTPQDLERVEQCLNSSS
ncbi:MAG: 3-deoxy-manno-octulosonate cytidylyltransferase [Nitrospirae bacterium]|nr:3-deoxy-manno-octulosonate cytidylyltransferase [Nitrospirota bacterium]